MNRRDFLKRSGATAAGAALAGTLASRCYAGEQNTIKIALVGCGHRGTGAAAQALSTPGPTRLWAVADVFPDRVESSLANLAQKATPAPQVPPERCFTGMDAYRKAIDALDPGSVVILATPPAFRPLHFAYAIARGCHVFMEKSFAVDAPGVHSVLKTGAEAARKNLKVATGLMSRHYRPLEGVIEQIHGGLIGDIITLWAYRVHGPVGFAEKAAGESELAHQIRNYSCFTWLNGSFLLDWLIHDLDICCWIKNAWPVSAQGQGGRQARIPNDQLFDHYACEYRFVDGTRMLAQGRHMSGCWTWFSDIVHGTKGSAEVGSVLKSPRIFKGYRQLTQDVIWEDKGPPCPYYQLEHDLLFDAIRKDKPYNETERSAMAAMTGILGRMACESGREITWDEAFASQRVLAPGLETMTMDSPAPVLPDAQGHYPVAIPGVTAAL